MALLFTIYFADDTHPTLSRTIGLLKYQNTSHNGRCNFVERTIKRIIVNFKKISEFLNVNSILFETLIARLNSSYYS
jgi:hypothetical protein